MHVQELNSQKLKGFESTQTTRSSIDNSNYVSYDEEESSNRQVLDNWSNDSEILLDDSLHVSDKECDYKEHTIDNNYENCRGYIRDDRFRESEVDDPTNSEIKDLRPMSSESTCDISSKTEIKSISNSTKECQNIFETYEDFDDALDF